MLESLHLYHIPRGSTDKVIPLELANQVRWRTCLRDIYLSPQALSLSVEGVDYYQGKEAYAFILEIACGIHSRILGETEIFSQFKEFVNQHDVKTKLPTISSVWQKIIQDVKYIRSHYLKNTGCQTYGSFLNEQVKGFDHLTFIGSGNLVREILPLMNKFTGTIEVLCRNPQNVFDLRHKHTQIIIDHLHKTTIRENARGLLVVAAPVSTDYLESFVSLHPAFEAAVDFRALDEGANISTIDSIRLDSIFEKISQNQNKLKNNLLYIKQEIAKRSTYWDQKLIYRPFGWEDICV